MPMMPLPKDGQYYWAKIPGETKLFIAQLLTNYWFVPGSNTAMKNIDIQIVSGPVEPPFPLSMGYQAGPGGSGGGSVAHHEIGVGLQLPSRIQMLKWMADAVAAGYVDGAIPTFQNEAKTCHVFYSMVNGTHTFTFEGTTDVQEWLVDFFALQVPVINHPKMGDVHAGFLLDVQSVLPYIVGFLHGLGYPAFYINGHSKGAGEALLAHGLLKDLGHPPLATYAFEPPRVGGCDLFEFIGGDDVSWTQTYNADGKDIITLVPAGPTWVHDGCVFPLQVPDDYDWAQRHKIPAIIEALAKG